jgi:hypothetical protein
MRNTVTVVLIGVMWVVAVGTSSAQIAGSTTTGVTVEELKTIARGWSATKQILGKSVYNDKHDKVGDVEDLIMDLRDGNCDGTSFVLPEGHKWPLQAIEGM